MLTTAVTRDPANGVLMVTLRGLLTVETAASVRAVLLKCLAEAPDAVLVDVSELHVRRASGLAVFPAALRAVGGDGAMLVLYGVGPELAPLLVGRPLGEVRVCGTLAQALAVAATGEQKAARRRLTLPPTRQAPARARAVVSQACHEWGVEHVASAAAQVVSELVSNAVEHAGPGDVCLTVALSTSYLHLSVSDGSSHPPVRQPIEPSEQETPPERGRGLFLVDLYATAWGTSPTPSGKTVWATLRARPVTAEATPTRRDLSQYG
jgi:anti-sigma regulatory factor (Ser/Thr protein kinase)/anti-anti-sigma regulatory factor